MQDRLKSRVWDKTRKVMHYDDFVITSTGYVAKLQVNIGAKNVKLNDGCFIINQTDLEPDKNCIVMQCSGLRDKNKTLIYEEDIIQDNETGMRAVIKWLDATKSLMGLILQADDYVTLDEFCADNLNCPLVVIGNTYQTPELLEGGKSVSISS